MAEPVPPIFQCWKSDCVKSWKPRPNVVSPLCVLIDLDSLSSSFAYLGPDTRSPPRVGTFHYTGLERAQSRWSRAGTQAGRAAQPPHWPYFTHFDKCGAPRRSPANDCTGSSPHPSTEISKVGTREGRPRSREKRQAPPGVRGPSRPHPPHVPRPPSHTPRGASGWLSLERKRRSQPRSRPGRP